MSMRRKLRKAYASATPDVWDRIAQACGGQKLPEYEEVPVGHPAKGQLPYWLSETLSTAAAAALLVCVCFGAGWFVTHFEPGPFEENPTYHTSQPTETTLPEETTVPSDKDILTDQQRQEISTAWYEKEGCDLGVWYGFPDEFGMYGKYRVRCYGIWRDYIILLHLPEQYLDYSETITIGDSVFQYRHPFDLIAYKDGEFYELEDLYEGGMLTNQDIAEIAKKHEG